MKKWISAWHQYWFAPRPLHSLALFRFAVGMVFFLYYTVRIPYAEDLFSNRSFHYLVAWFDWLPVFSPLVAQILVGAAMLCAACFALGWLTPLFHLGLLGLTAYLGILEGVVAPVCFNLLWVSLFLLLFSPAGRYGSLDYWLWRRKHPAEKSAARQTGPFWTARLIVIQLALVYLSSAFYRMMVAPGWFTGTHVWKIFTDHSFGQMPLGLWFADQAGMLPFIGTAVLLLEISLPVMLLTPQYRNLGVIIGLAYHLLIYFSVNLTGFYLLTMAAHYILVLPPENLKIWFEKVWQGIGEKYESSSVSRAWGN